MGETKNPAYEHILSHLHEIRNKGESVRLDKAIEAWEDSDLGARGGSPLGAPCGGTVRERGVLACSPPDQKTSVPPFNVAELLPPQLDQFFRYNGSLTTPPCYQSVLWTVFNRKAQISMEQVSGDEVREQRCNGHLRPFPSPQSEGCSSPNPILLLLSWKSFRRHCSPQKRSPRSSWYGTTEPPSLSISEQSLLLSSKVNVQGLEKETRSWGAPWQELGSPWEEKAG